MNFQTSDSYIFDAADVQARIKDGLANLEFTWLEDINFDDPKQRVTLLKEDIVITDMQWDPFEDNLLVSFGDNSMALVTFQGLDSQTFIAKKFEKTPQ